MAQSKSNQNGVDIVISAQDKASEAVKSVTSSLKILGRESSNVSTETKTLSNVLEASKTSLIAVADSAKYSGEQMVSVAAGITSLGVSIVKSTGIALYGVTNLTAAIEIIKRTSKSEIGVQLIDQIKTAAENATKEVAPLSDLLRGLGTVSGSFAKGALGGDSANLSKNFSQSLSSSLEGISNTVYSEFSKKFGDLLSTPATDGSIGKIAKRVDTELASSVKNGLFSLAFGQGIVRNIADNLVNSPEIQQIAPQFLSSLFGDQSVTSAVDGLISSISTQFAANNSFAGLLDNLSIPASAISFDEVAKNFDATLSNIVLDGALDRVFKNEIPKNIAKGMVSSPLLKNALPDFIQSLSSGSLSDSAKSLTNKILTDSFTSTFQTLAQTVKSISSNLGTNIANELINGVSLETKRKRNQAKAIVGNAFDGVGEAIVKRFVLPIDKILPGSSQIEQQLLRVFGGAIGGGIEKQLINKVVAPLIDSASSGLANTAQLAIADTIGGFFPGYLKNVVSGAIQESNLFQGLFEKLLNKESLIGQGDGLAGIGASIGESIRTAIEENFNPKGIKDFVAGFSDGLLSVQQIGVNAFGVLGNSLADVKNGILSINNIFPILETLATGAINAVVVGIENVKTAIKSSASFLISSIGIINGAFDNLISYGISGLTSLKTSFVSLGSGFNPVVSGIKSLIGGLTNIKENIYNLSVIARVAISQIANQIVGLSTNIQGSLLSSIGTISDVLKETSSLSSSFLSGAANSLDGLIQIIGSIQGTFAGTIQSFRSSFESLLPEINAVIDASFAKLDEFTAFAGKQVNEAFKGSVNVLGDLFDGFFKNIYPNLKKAFDQVDAFFGGTFSAAISQLATSAGVSFGSSFFGAWFDTLVPGLDAIDSAILSTVDNLSTLSTRIAEPIGAMSALPGAIAGFNEPLEVFNIFEGVVGEVTNGIFDLTQKITFFSQGMEALKSFVQTGPFQLLIGQSIELREQLLSTQASLVGTSKLSQGGQEITDPTKAIKSLDGPVSSIINKMRTESLELVGVTSKDLVPLFQILASKMAGVGGNLEDAKDLTLDFAASMGTINLPLGQAQQEIASIINGQIDMNSALAKSLNITNEQVSQWKAQGKFVEILRSKLEAFRAGNKLAAQSVGGITSNIQEIFDNVGRLAGEKLLDPLIEQLDGVYQYLLQNQAALTQWMGEITDELLKIGLAGADTLKSLFNSLGGLVSEVPGYLFTSLSNAVVALGDAIKTTLAVLQPAIDLITELAKAAGPLGGQFLKFYLQLKSLEVGISSVGRGFGILSQLIPGVGEGMFAIDLRSQGLVNQFITMSGVVQQGAAGFLLLGSNLDKIPGAMGIVTQALGPIGAVLGPYVPMLSGIGIQTVGLIKLFPVLGVALGGLLTIAPALVQVAKVGLGSLNIAGVSLAPIFAPLSPIFDNLSNTLGQYANASDRAGKINELFKTTLVNVGKAAANQVISWGTLAATAYIAFRAFDYFVLKNEGVMSNLKAMGQGLSTIIGIFTNPWVLGITTAIAAVVALRFAVLTLNPTLLGLALQATSLVAAFGAATGQLPLLIGGLTGLAIVVGLAQKEILGLIGTSVGAWFLNAAANLEKFAGVLRLFKLGSLADEAINASKGFAGMSESVVSLSKLIAAKAANAALDAASATAEGSIAAAKVASAATITAANAEVAAAELALAAATTAAAAERAAATGASSAAIIAADQAVVAAEVELALANTAASAAIVAGEASVAAASAAGGAAVSLAAVDAAAASTAAAGSSLGWGALAGSIWATLSPLLLLAAPFILVAGAIGAVTLALGKIVENDASQAVEEYGKITEQVANNTIGSIQELSAAKKKQKAADIQGIALSSEEYAANKKAIAQGKEKIKLIEDNIATLNNAKKEAKNDKQKDQIQQQIDELTKLKETLTSLSSDVKIEPKDLTVLGDTITQLKNKADGAWQAILKPSGDPNIFKQRAGEVVDLTQKLLEMGQISPDQAIDRFKQLADDNRLDQEVQLKAQEGITKAIETESKKRIDIIQRQQSEVQAALKSGQIGEAEAAKETTQLKVKELEEQKRAVLDKQSSAESFGNVEGARAAAEEVKKIQADLTAALGEEAQRRNKELLKNYDEQLSALKRAKAEGKKTDEDFAKESAQIETAKADEEIRQLQEQLGKLQSTDKEGREAINAQIDEAMVKKREILEKAFQEELNAIRQDTEEQLKIEEAKLEDKKDLAKKSTEISVAGLDKEIETIKAQKQQISSADKEGQEKLDAQLADAVKKRRDVIQKGLEDTINAIKEDADQQIQIEEAKNESARDAAQNIEKISTDSIDKQIKVLNDGLAKLGSTDKEGRDKILAQIASLENQKRAAIQKGIDDEIAAVRTSSEARLKIANADLAKGKTTEKAFNEENLKEQQRALDEEESILEKARSKTTDIKAREKISGQIAEIERKRIDILAQFQQKELELLKKKEDAALDLVQESENNRIIEIQKAKNKGLLSDADVEDEKIGLTKKRLEEQLRLEKELLSKQVSQSPLSDPAAEAERQDKIREQRKKTQEITIQLLENEAKAWEAYVNKVLKNLDRQNQKELTNLQKQLNAGQARQEDVALEKAKDVVQRLEEQLKLEKDRGKQIELNLQLEEARGSLLDAQMAKYKQEIDEATTEFENGIRKENAELTKQQNIIDTANKALEMRSQILAAQKGLSDAASGFATGQLEAISKIERSEFKRKQLAEIIAAIKLKSAIEQAEYDAKSLEIEQEKQRLSLARELIANRMAQGEGKINVRKAEGALAVAQRDPRTSSAQIEKLQLDLQNARDLLALKQQEGGLLQSQQGNQEKLFDMQRRAQDFKSRGNITSAKVDAASAIASPGARRRALEGVRGDILNDFGVRSTNELLGRGLSAAEQNRQEAGIVPTSRRLSGEELLQSALGDRYGSAKLNPSGELDRQFGNQLNSSQAPIIDSRSFSPLAMPQSLPVLPGISSGLSGGGLGGKANEISVAPNISVTINADTKKAGQEIENAIAPNLEKVVTETERLSRSRFSFSK